MNAKTITISLDTHKLLYSIKSKDPSKTFDTIIRNALEVHYGKR